MLTDACRTRMKRDLIEKCRPFPRAVKDVDDFHTIGEYPIENQIVAMDQLAEDLASNSTGHGKAVRLLTERQAPLAKLYHEADRALGIVLGDPIGDRFEIGFGRTSEADSHAADLAAMA